MVELLPKNGINGSALVLNANYAPLTICSVKRAICLIYLDKVDILEERQELVHSPSINMPIPSVIKLRSYLRYNSIEVILSRRNILLRDNFECVYCGTKSRTLTIDHIIPRERGGPDTWDNLVTACSPCNLKKSNRTPEEAGMVLRKRPIKPNRILLFSNNLLMTTDRIGVHICSWKVF